MLSQQVNVFWFRRDLRLDDNVGLFHALSSGLPVLPIFIFDKNILSELDDKYDARVSFIHQCLEQINQILQTFDSTLYVLFDNPEDAFRKLLKTFSLVNVFTNHDYEPYAIQRDEKIKKYLQVKNIGFKTFKDQVIFEKEEVTKGDGGFYSVYTPYAKKWLSQLGKEHYRSYNTEKIFKNFLKHSRGNIPTLQSLGFEKSKIEIPKLRIDKLLINSYHQTRDFPNTEGTTRLGMHLRFGTVSIRHLVKIAKEVNEVFLKELVWREFFMQILWHNPNVISQSFKPQYEQIKWRYDEKDFKKWCEGKTGYPIVDAGMRQLNEIGFMHNRVRMITGSFLVKHLLIDWRWGEAYFAKKLLDYELSSNNGNWQWVAGCGCDAAPYFRIFNPTTQAKKFDAKQVYIKKWIPELDTDKYPKPMVDHETARARCLSVYKEALRSNRVATHK